MRGTFAGHTKMASTPHLITKYDANRYGMVPKVVLSRTKIPPSSEVGAQIIEIKKAMKEVRRTRYVSPPLRGKKFPIPLSFYVTRKKSPLGGKGVFAKTHLFPGLLLPMFYLGYVYDTVAEVPLPHTHVGLFRDSDGTDMYIDSREMKVTKGSPMNAGNINAASTRRKSNCVIPFAKQYTTWLEIIKHITPGQELRAYYGSEYYWGDKFIR